MRRKKSIHLIITVMNRLLLMTACMAATITIAAQNESFDIFSYQAPAGWKKEKEGNLLKFTKIDNASKTWCVITLVKSTASKGSIEADFTSEWNELVVKNYNPTEKMEETNDEADGWKIRASAGKFRFNNSEAVVLITTMSGHKVCASVVATTNNNAFMTDIQSFLNNINLKKPAGGNTGASLQPTLNTPGTDPGPVSTRFDDGWVSTVKNDWVEVTKGDINVFLWYALPYNASSFSGTGVVDRDYYWDNFVSKYYTIQTKQYKDNGEVIGSLKPGYVEGWAVDKQNGEKRFIGMRLDISPNTASVVIGSAKDEASLWAQFPKANGSAFGPSDLSAMRGYNKFAVTEKELLGTWVDGGSSAIQWYYVSPSGNTSNAGMQVAARSSTYHFNSGGNYTSIHNGATGMVGNMNTFQQNYKGKYNVTSWTLTATNRFEGKTQAFNAWFEIIRGGRILHLQDQKYTGYQENLVKEK